MPNVWTCTDEGRLVRETLCIALLLCVACGDRKHVPSMQHRCEAGEIDDEYKRWLLECIKSGNDGEPGELVSYCETATRRLFCPMRESCKYLTAWEACSND